MSADAEVVRSIRLPKRVWDALDKDAARCRRSSVKQLEALLVTYYGLDDVEIDKDALDVLRADRHLDKGRKEIPVVSAVAGGLKRGGRKRT